MKRIATMYDPVLQPDGFTGFGDGYYAITAAWPVDMLPMDVGCCRKPVNPQNHATCALNRLGYFGPGMWADAWGGLVAAGCLDADVL